MDSSDKAGKLSSRRWFKVAAGIIISVGLFFLLLPLGARLYLVHWLEKNGAQKAEIESLRYNPFTSKLSVKGIAVQAGEKSMLSNTSMEIDLDLLSLFKKNVHLQKVLYQDLFIDLEQYDNGSWRIGSYTLKGRRKDTAAETKEGKTPWAFLNDHTILNNCTIALTTPQLSLILHVEEGELNRFSTRQDDSTASFTLKGTLNDEKLLIDLKGLRVLPETQIEGIINIASFDLEEVESFLQDVLPQFKGTMGLDGEISFTSRNAGEKEAVFIGQLIFQQVDLGNESYEFAGDKLEWRGDFSYASASQSDQNLTIDGLFSAKDIELKVIDSEIKLEESEIELKGQTAISIGENLTVKHQGEFRKGPAAFKMPTLTASDKGLSWTGTTEYVSRYQDSNNNVSTDGELVIRDLRIAGSEQDNAFLTQTANIQWQGNFSYAFLNQSDHHITTDGLFSANNIELNAIDREITLQQSEIELKGKSVVNIGEELTVTHQGEFQKGAADLEMPALTVSDSGLNWVGTAEYASSSRNNKNVVSTNGELELHNLIVTAGEMDNVFSSQTPRIQWQGDIDFQQNDVQESLLNLSGTLTSEELHSSINNGTFLVKQPVTRILFDHQIKLGETREITGSGSFELNGFEMYEQEAEVPLVSLAHFLANGIEGKGSQGIAIDDLQVSDIVANISGNMPLTVSLKNLEVNNTETSDFTTYEAAELNLKKLNVVSQLSNMELARFDSLFLNTISSEINGDLSIAEARLNTFVFLSGPFESTDKPALSIAEAKLQSLHIPKEQPPEMESLQLQELTAKVTRSANGEFAINSILSAIQIEGEDLPHVEENQPQEDEAASALALPLMINELVISEKSGLYYEDYTLPVPFKTNLEIKKFEIITEKQNEKSLKTQISIKGQMEQRAPLKLEGTLQTEEEKLRTSLALDLKNYPLKKLAGYTAKAVGRGLSSGQLQLESNFALDGRMLDMQNGLLLKKLKTETLSEELAAELDNELPIPLDSALSILRDKKDNISLDIPIKGSIDDISINITDLIVTALSKAIIPAATSYLTYVLGPYAALTYVGYKVGEKMLQVNLPAIEYATLEIEIPVEQNDYLNRVAQILQERENASLQICPHVAASEMSAAENKDTTKQQPTKKEAKPLDENTLLELEQLGQQRADLLKEYFIAEHTIDEDRLLICDTTIIRDENAVSSVKLQL